MPDRLRHTDDEIGGQEGLRQVEIGAREDARIDVGLVVARGEHHHLRASELGVGPDGFEDLDARAAWHLDVEQHERRLSLLDQSPSLFAVARLDHLVFGRFDCGVDKNAKFGLVVDYQNRLPLADCTRRSEARPATLNVRCCSPREGHRPVIRLPAWKVSLRNQVTCPMQIDGRSIVRLLNSRRWLRASSSSS